MSDIRDLFDDRIAAVGKIAAIDTATIVSILVRSGLCTADEFTRRRVAIAAEFDQLLAEKIRTDCVLYSSGTDAYGNVN